MPQHICPACSWYAATQHRPILAVLQVKLQQREQEAEQAAAQAEKQGGAAREAFQQASEHARAAQQAQTRCHVLDQAVRKAERRVEGMNRLQQVRSEQQGHGCLAGQGYAGWIPVMQDKRLRGNASSNAG